MNRRGFFSAIAGGLAAPVLPAVIPATIPEPSAMQPVVGLIAYDVIHAAARLLGVITPGEALPQSDFEEGLFHFQGLMAERRWNGQSQLSFALAQRMAPIYGGGIRFYPTAFALTWPRLGS